MSAANWNHWKGQKLAIFLREQVVKPPQTFPACPNSWNDHCSTVFALITQIHNILKRVRRFRGFLSIRNALMNICPFQVFKCCTGDVYQHIQILIYCLILIYIPVVKYQSRNQNLQKNSQDRFHAWVDRGAYLLQSTTIFLIWPQVWNIQVSF